MVAKFGVNLADNEHFKVEITDLSHHSFDRLPDSGSVDLQHLMGFSPVFRCVFRLCDRGSYSITCGSEPEIVLFLRWSATQEL